MKTLLLSLSLLLLLVAQSATAGTVTYVYTDQQGTPLAEADATGTITARFDYAPYGAASTTSGMSGPPNGPGYTGHVNDPESGFVYMQARYYDASVGRFLATDPAGITAGNIFTFGRYVYTNNNPITNIDPNGEATEIAMRYIVMDSGFLGWTFGHEFLTMRDTNSGVYYVSRAGPSGAYPYADAISNSSVTYKNSEGKSGVMTLLAFTGLFSQSAEDTGEPIHTVTGSVVVVPDDLSTVLKKATAISEAVNAANIPYLPQTTNSNSYANTTYQWLTGKAAPHQDVFDGPETPLPVAKPSPPSPPPCKSVYPGECQ